jgi:hypothetical protein
MNVQLFQRNISNPTECNATRYSPTPTVSADFRARSTRALCAVQRKVTQHRHHSAPFAVCSRESTESEKELEKEKDKKRAANNYHVPGRDQTASPLVRLSVVLNREGWVSNPRGRAGYDPTSLEQEKSGRW